MAQFLGFLPEAFRFRPVSVGHGDRTDSPGLMQALLELWPGSQLSQWARTGAAIVDCARRFRRHDSHLTAAWTCHRHGSLFREQDRAAFGGQLGASTPSCLAYEAGAKARPLWRPYGRRYGRDLR